MRVHIFCIAIAAAICFLLSSYPAGAQSPTATPSTAPQTGSHPESEKPAEEITSREQTTTFKVNVNLVQVRVVVRDNSGHAVGNLTKDDFELFDDRKPQNISQFAVEQGGALGALAHPHHETNGTGEQPTQGGAADVGESYVAYVFDDVHLGFGDLAQARRAAEHYVAAMRPTDRAGVFTTSGQIQLDFTDDHGKVRDTLLRLQPRPITRSETHACFQMTYYMADLIQNKHDPQATIVATQDALACNFNNDPRMQSAAAQFAETASEQALQSGMAESHVTLTVVNDVLRRMSVLPGQRIMVIVSPGFLAPEMEAEYTESIDRALRARVVIGAIDARGLYVPGMDDLTAEPAPSAVSQGTRQQYATLEASAASDVLIALSNGTGGAFFQNSNDLEEGFRRTASTPEYSYILGYSPAKLKLDGSFHSIRINLKNGAKLTLQARRGYFAPRHAADPAQQAKQEIEEALFSQDDVHTLPVQLHTQFFKSSDVDAKLTVLAHIDVKRLALKKKDGRNNDELTVVSALFNGNGSLLQGIEKTVTMRIRDETLEKRLGPGITLKTSFDVKPGSYLVRLVVRDAEAQMVSAESDAIRIP